MSNQPLQHTEQKAPGFFRLLALLLLALAMVEVPFGIGSAFAGQERTPNQSWEMRQAGHDSPVVTAVETAIDGPVQAAAERRFGELDEPVVAATYSGVVSSDRSATRGSLFQPDLVPALACICSARDPPWTI